MNTGYFCPGILGGKLLNLFRTNNLQQRGILPRMWRKSPLNGQFGQDRQSENWIGKKRKFLNRYQQSTYGDFKNVWHKACNCIGQQRTTNNRATKMEINGIDLTTLYCILEDYRKATRELAACQHVLGVTDKHSENTHSENIITFEGILYDIETEYGNTLCPCCNLTHCDCIGDSTN
jgi:hypothetical protein